GPDGDDRRVVVAAAVEFASGGLAGSIRRSHRRSTAECRAEANGPASPGVRGAVRDRIVARVTVPDWLGQRADLTPQRTALVFGDRPRTFAELDRLVDGAAAALRERGVAALHRIGILGANSPGFVIGFHPLTRIGAVVGPLN